jgi:RND family efflux transporter MFP subunit
VYAPISGTITATPQKIGATVYTGTSVASIGDISNLQVSAKIPERDIAVLKTGLKAIVTFEAYPGVEFPAHAFRVSPLVDPASRTKEIFLSFDSKDERINSGMFARIKLFTTVTKGCVTVPEESIVTADDKKYAFIVGSDNTVAKREVTVGASVDGVCEILSGLKAGERVADQGVSSLADGAKVKDISAKSETSCGGAQ